MLSFITKIYQKRQLVYTFLLYINIRRYYEDIMSATVTDTITTKPLQGNFAADGETGVNLNATDEGMTVPVGQSDSIDALAENRVGNRFFAFSDPNKGITNEHGETLDIGNSIANLNDSIQRQIDNMINAKNHDMAMTNTINSTNFPPGFTPIKSPMGVLVMTPNCVTITMNDYNNYMQQLA